MMNEDLLLPQKMITFFRRRINMGKFRNWIDTNISLHTHDNAKEEKLNSLTHAAGAAAGLAGLIIMIIHGAGSPVLGGAVIFCITMIMMFTGSALYHFARPSTAKRLLRIFDHSNIYFLIAGTYTPFCFKMASPAGSSILIIIWSLVAAGIAFTLVFWGKLKPLHVVFYLAMGWMIVLFWKDFTSAFPESVIGWILAGGIFYTAGIIFYASKKLPHYHAIWHLFVVGGCACFYLGIFLHLL